MLYYKHDKKQNDYNRVIQSTIEYNRVIQSYNRKCFL